MKGLLQNWCGNLFSFPRIYAGVCLFSLNETTNTIYTKLGFTEHEDLMILDKTDENLAQIKAKLPDPITTDFYSTYPDNIIT